MTIAKQRFEMEILSLLRFVLAVSVVVEHLWPAVGLEAGRHAVVGFFCISGFLITRISLTSYRNRPGAFLLNRFLRIYPQYLLAAVLGGIVVASMPETAMKFNPSLQWPSTLLDWFHQIFIFGLNGAPVRLSPPTWSLNIEIYFYLIIGLLTHRSEKGTYIALFISSILGLMGLCHVGGIGFYASSLGNAFLFFLGSSAYFVSKRVNISRWIPLVALGVYALLGYVVPQIIIHHPRFFDCLLVPSALMVFLILLKMPVIHTESQRLVTGFNFLGRISYPLFLVHWAASTPWFSWVGQKEPALFVGGLFLSLIVASLMVLAIDRPMEIIRTKIRKKPSINDLHPAHSPKK